MGLHCKLHTAENICTLSYYDQAHHTVLTSEIFEMPGLKAQYQLQTSTI